MAADATTPTTPSPADSETSPDATERRCLVGIPGCECDYNSPEWIAEMRTKGVDLDPVNSFCECHDCYTCGEIDCDGHAEPEPDTGHTCEPRWWPHHLGDTWRCECGHGYHVAYARDMGGVAPKAIRLGILDPDTLGWQSDAR